MQMIVLILFAVAVRVAIAGGNPPAPGVCPIRRREVTTAQESRRVAELPNGVGRIAIHPTGDSQAGMEPRGNVAGRHVHDAAESGGPVERGAGALQDLDALDVVHREQVPVDSAAVALIHGDAVDRHEYARVQTLHVSCRAAQVDLAIHELHAGDVIDRFIDRRHGAAAQLSLADLRDGGGGPVAEVRNAVADDVDGRECERLGPQREVERRRVAARQGDRRVHERMSDRGGVDAHGAGGNEQDAVHPLAIGARRQRRAGNRNARAHQHLALRAADSAPQDALRGRRERRGDEQQRGYCAVHVTKLVAGRRLSKLTTKSISPAAGPLETETTPRWVESAGLR